MSKISRLGLRAMCVFLTALGASASAQAATISLTGDAWRLANGQASHVVNGVTAMAGYPATLSADAKDGLGVRTVGAPVVSGEDLALTAVALAEGPVTALTIAFDKATMVRSFTVLQTVQGAKGDRIGYYRVDDGDWQSIIVGNNGKGAFDVALDQLPVSHIAFAVNAAFTQGYWLRSIETSDVTAVAEPTSMALMGACLLVGAARLRRRR